jgi:hypothetical protein
MQLKMCEVAENHIFVTSKFKTPIHSRVVTVQRLEALRHPRSEYFRSRQAVQESYLVLLTKYRAIAGVRSSKRRIWVRAVCGKLSIRRIFEDVRNTGASRFS